jgi:hypothetical protein
VDAEADAYRPAWSGLSPSGAGAKELNGENCGNTARFRLRDRRPFENELRSVRNSGSVVQSVFAVCLFKALHAPFHRE